MLNFLSTGAVRFHPSDETVYAPAGCPGSLEPFAGVTAGAWTSLMTLIVFLEAASAMSYIRTPAAEVFTKTGTGHSLNSGFCSNAQALAMTLVIACAETLCSQYREMNRLNPLASAEALHAALKLQERVGLLVRVVMRRTGPVEMDSKRGAVCRQQVFHQTRRVTKLLPE